MPVVANEATNYGYEAEDRHFLRAVPRLRAPVLKALTQPFRSRMRIFGFVIQT